jgi:hypothetical protein
MPTPIARPSPPVPGRIPAHVRRAVWRRDHGMCQWPLDSGGICGATSRSELDSAEPRVLGGPPTVANVRVLCDFHADLAGGRASSAPAGAALESRRRRAALQ